MTKKDARKAIKILAREGWRDLEIIRYESSWRVYATERFTGYRIHFDTMAQLVER